MRTGAFLGRFRAFFPSRMNDGRAFYGALNGVLLSACISHSDIFAQRLSFPGMRIASTQKTVARVTTHAHAGAD